MSLKWFLLLMTAIAVVSDSMLHPFYPQYFAHVFGVTDARHVGSYIAACALTVMLSFPLWALLARRVPVLLLLIGTQIATGVLSVVCWALTSLTAFWVVSLVMMVFKASYLLIYPYVLGLDDQRNHVATISLLAFVVYFGNILAALLGGTLFELVDARFLFIGMACGDVLQTLLCLHLLRRPEVTRTPRVSAPAALAPPRAFVRKLGVVMFVLYFSAYLTDPFFSSYWEGVSAVDNKVLAGIVFAIPGVAALLALYVNASGRGGAAAHVGILPAIALGVCGLLLQVSGERLLVVVGRVLYGWALFQAMVRLDALLFRYTTPDSYAVEFSKANLFQGLGVLAASLTAGSLVLSFDARIPFIVAALGFVFGLILYFGLLRKELASELTPAHEGAELHGEGGTV